MRHRLYYETADWVHGTAWRETDPVIWVGSDTLDPKRPEYNVAPELYNLDCVAYESILLGLFTIFRGERLIREKPNDVCVGYSRDGFHWARPDREAFLPVSEHYGDWNWANVQSAGGGCLVVGDRLYFYVSGRAGVRGSESAGACSTGLATLRRDGFASLDAIADRLPRIAGLAPRARQVTTRPVKFSGLLRQWHRLRWPNRPLLTADGTDRPCDPVGGRNRRFELNSIAVHNVWNAMY